MSDQPSRQDVAPTRASRRRAMLEALQEESLPEVPPVPELPPVPPVPPVPPLPELAELADIPELASLLELSDPEELPETVLPEELPEPALPESLPEPEILSESALPESLPEPEILPAPALPESSPEPTLAEILPEPTLPELLQEPPRPADPQPSSRRDQRDRHSFLQDERRDEPARMGMRGALNRIGFTLAPGPFEQSMRDNELLVGQRWPGPRTIAVVNGKGGAGKTPTTALLSAVFARYGGAGVLAWDNNQTRGTLGWRTETGAHERTLLELLPETERLLGAGAQSADLAHYVHHQPGEKYDVLRSKPIRLAPENRLNPSHVDAIHAVAARFYRLIVIDSGNDESDPMWLRMIDHADQLVVATSTRSDHAEAGALLLEALEERDEHSSRLARDAVVVVTQADPRASTAEVQHVVAGYQDLAREVVTIPFDQEMVDGHLRLGGLSPVTQHAWLAAGAAVARGL